MRERRDMPPDNTKLVALSVLPYLRTYHFVLAPPLRYTLVFLYILYVYMIPIFACLVK